MTCEHRKLYVTDFANQPVALDGCLFCERDEALRKLSSTEQLAGRLAEQVKGYESRLNRFDEIRRNSDGVAGYHLNGDIATWDELLDEPAGEAPTNPNDISSGLVDGEAAHTEARSEGYSLDEDGRYVLKGRDGEGREPEAPNRSRKPGAGCGKFW